MQDSAASAAGASAAQVEGPFLFDIFIYIYKYIFDDVWSVSHVHPCDRCKVKVDYIIGSRYGDLAPLFGPSLVSVSVYYLRAAAQCRRPQEGRQKRCGADRRHGDAWVVAQNTWGHRGVLHRLCGIPNVRRGQEGVLHRLRGEEGAGRG